MMLLKTSFLLALVTTSLANKCWQSSPCTGPSEPAFLGPWTEYSYSPSSRVVRPSTQFPLDAISEVVKYPGAQTLKSNASATVYDFGQAVGGIATITYRTTGDAGRLGLAFTEAKNWIGLASDSSNGPFARGTGDQACGDGAIYDAFSGAGEHTYTVELKHLRGSFRYLTAFLLTNGTSTLSISSVSVKLDFAPEWPHLQAYQGYFYSNDDDLNKIWYAGAYTLQMNVVPQNTGRSWNPPITVGWANNDTLTNGSVAIVDGAKRDRTVWPGDMGVAVPAAFVSLGDLSPVYNALQSLFDHQTSEGELPFAGLPVLAYGGDAYHLWTMIGVYNYVLYTNDTAFLAQNWNGYQKAMEYIYAKVLPSIDLLNVTGTGDWGRLYSSGTYSEANMLMYKVLTTGSDLANWVDDASVAQTYSSRASTLRRSIKQHFYDSSYGAFHDNLTTTSVYPQDANSMSILFGVVSDTSNAAHSISDRLTDNWTPIGAETPELPDNISPFISSLEIQAHLTVGETSRALDLIRRSWGWYLHNENGTQSTLIEGYLTNGSFGYRNYDGYEWDSSYTSHAHGWSCGPTSALTEYVLGLRVTGRAGKQWTLEPMFGDLEWVEGGFTTVLGKFSAKWRLLDDEKGYTVEWTVPENTSGTVVLPATASGKKANVEMNGKRIASIVGQAHAMSVGGGKAQVIVKVA